MHAEALLIDINGVLVDAWRPVPGAVAALRDLRTLDVPLRFVTNATSTTAEGVADRLCELGFEVTPEEMHTAPLATSRHLAHHHPDAAVYLLSDGDVRADFADQSLVAEPSDADVIVVGGAGPGFTHDAMSGVFRAALDGTPLVAIHRGLYWKAEPGLVLDTGAYLAGIEEAAGVTATVVGKPSPDFFITALEDLDVVATGAVMIGDDLHSDVLAAQDLGMAGVLVRTGKFRAERLEESLGRPTAVVDSIVDVPALFD